MTAYQLRAYSLFFKFAGLARLPLLCLEHMTSSNSYCKSTNDLLYFMNRKRLSLIVTSIDCIVFMFEINVNVGAELNVAKHII